MCISRVITNMSLPLKNKECVCITSTSGFAKAQLLPIKK